MSIKKVLIEVADGHIAVVHCPDGVVVAIVNHDNRSDSIHGAFQDIVDSKAVDEAVDQAAAQEKWDADEKKASSHSLETNMHARDQG